MLLFSVEKIVSYLSYFLVCEAEGLYHFEAALEELLGQVNKIEGTRLSLDSIHSFRRSQQFRCEIAELLAVVCFLLHK